MSVCFHISLTTKKCNFSIGNKMLKQNLSSDFLYRYCSMNSEFGFHCILIKILSLKRISKYFILLFRRLYFEIISNALYQAI